MSAIDTEILAMFNALSPTRQGQLLDSLGQLLEEQGKGQGKRWGKGHGKEQGTQN
jgi:hypothetical protein